MLLICLAQEYLKQGSFATNKPVRHNYVKKQDCSRLGSRRETWERKIKNKIGQNSWGRALETLSEYGFSRKDIQERETGWIPLLPPPRQSTQLLRNEMWFKFFSPRTKSYDVTIQKLFLSGLSKGAICFSVFCKMQFGIFPVYFDFGHSLKLKS